MQLEFHQLDRRWANLRVRDPLRQRHLLASLAEGGQQTPIVVVETGGRCLVIDGHKRIAALEQLGRDTVDAVVWEMNEADALLLSRSIRFSPPESALEQGWLLSEMEQRFHYSLDELARRFDRSTNWVSRRMALVDLLPEAVQQQVREGKIGAQVAMKHLVPVARADANDCLRLATIFIEQRCDSRAARATLHGLAQRHAHRSRPHPRRAGVVPQNPTPDPASGRNNNGHRTSGTRSGSGAGHAAPREQTAQRSATRNEPRTTETDAVPHRGRAP